MARNNSGIHTSRAQRGKRVVSQATATAIAPANEDLPVGDPRLTEERLRYYLDSNQVMRERMCLALLPLLGAFTEARPRRPKGGADGARDIECAYQGKTPTWGAVGFRNGGGNDSEARTAAMKKFRDDLDAALAENADLRSFVFFTNVDLTPGLKDELKEYGVGKNVQAVHVFDMEILRNGLDSQEGLRVREQYLGIPISEATDWRRAVEQDSVIRNPGAPTIGTLR
jgi:hypothetical protein